MLHPAYSTSAAKIGEVPQHTDRFQENSLIFRCAAQPQHKVGRLQLESRPHAAPSPRGVLPGPNAALALVARRAALGDLYVALTRATQRACVACPAALDELGSTAELAWRRARRADRRLAFGRLSVGSLIGCARSGRFTGFAVLGQS